MKFQIGRIPVSVHGTFWLTGFVFGADLKDPVRIALWMAIVFVSVLMHELGHALAFLRFGHTPSIELYLMGGVTRGSPGTETTAGRDLLISLAGPFAGFCVGAVVLGLQTVIAPSSEIATDVFRDLLWANFGWGVLNLLPIYPLDGGQALSAGLRALFPAKGERIALVVALVAAAGAGVLALATKWWWPAYIAVTSGLTTYRRLQRAIALGDDGALAERLLRGHKELEAKRTVAAREIANEVRTRAKTPLMQREARLLLAWIEVAEDRYSDAYELIKGEGDAIPAVLRGVVLAKLPGREKEAIRPLADAFGANPNPTIGDALVKLLLAHDLDGAHRLILGPNGGALAELTQAKAEAVMFEAGRFKEAFELSDARFRRTKHPLAAYNAACGLARLDRLDEAASWLGKAVEAGLENPKRIAEDPDLEKLRGRSDVEALIAKA